MALRPNEGMGFLLNNVSEIPMLFLYHDNLSMGT